MFFKSKSGPIKIQWSEDMAVGVPSLDDDHKSFFEMVESIRRIQRFGSVNNWDFDNIKMILSEYVEGHFLREELFLVKGPYNEYVLHKRQHDSFRSKLSKFLTTASSIEENMEEIALLVESWIPNHIQKWDFRYRDWVKAEDVDPRPLGLLLSSRSRL